MKFLEFPGLRIEDGSLGARKTGPISALSLTSQVALDINSLIYKEGTVFLTCRAAVNVQ